MSRRAKQRSSRKRDPHLARERRRYDRPIPSREFILDLLAETGVPMSRDEVASQLELSTDEDLEALRRRLNAMERDGQLIRNRKGGFCRVNKRDLIAGRVIGHPDGFGFLKPDEGGDDLFLTPRQMRGLMHDDRAVVRVTGLDRRGRREAAVVEVLERNTHQVVGRLFLEAGVGFIEAEHKRIAHEVVIPATDQGGGQHGQMVVAEIIEQPTPHSQPVGRVIEVLGDRMAPGMSTDVAIRSHGLPADWPEAVEEEIAGLGPEVPDKAKKGRRDLRDLPLVTIDGADARDFDDAVFCERTDKGWRLIVAIADVSCYVLPGTALDGEGRQRGNSVYFPDRVIPMLPEVLSNGLCSLNPKVDRLCLACQLTIDNKGKVTRSSFFEGVMRSHARLTYDEVAKILVDGHKTLRKRHAKLVPHLEDLHGLFKRLTRARDKRGAIDFDTTETRIVFGGDHKVERIAPLVRNDAHRIIEECMLAANVAAARFLSRKKVPALYRVHESPPQDKLEDLRTFLNELGLKLGGGKNPQPGDFAALLGKLGERPDRHLIQTVVLRSMAQAIYSPDNAGHFGLAYDGYTHFTSPIRRYPDLLVHRAIRHMLRGGKAEEFEYPGSEIQAIGEHCSATERKADEATRDAVDWLKCEFMLDKVGEEFDALITGVTSFGFFAELEGIYIDGLVHITSLDNDYYHFDPIHHHLTGERSGTVYRLTDRVRVRVARVDLDERRIDFALAAPPKGVGGKKRRSRGGRRRR